MIGKGKRRPKPVDLPSIIEDVAEGRVPGLTEEQYRAALG